jgi:hypothetical protein
MDLGEQMDRQTNEPETTEQIVRRILARRLQQEGVVPLGRADHLAGVLTPEVCLMIRAAREDRR